MSPSVRPDPCRCISSNRPSLGGSNPDVALVAPAWSSHDTICVDDCMVDVIECLWAAGYVTRGCCCGHNGAVASRPHVILDEHELDVVGALNVVRAVDDRAVALWQLHEGEIVEVTA